MNGHLHFFPECPFDEICDSFLDTKSLLTCTLSVCENDDFKVLSGQMINFILMPNSDLIESVTLFPISTGSTTTPQILLDYIDDTRQKVQLNLTDTSCLMYKILPSKHFTI